VLTGPGRLSLDHVIATRTTGGDVRVRATTAVGQGT
jgi:hypothetical protein